MKTEIPRIPKYSGFPFPHPSYRRGVWVAGSCCWCLCVISKNNLFPLQKNGSETVQRLWVVSYTFAAILTMNWKSNSCLYGVTWELACSFSVPRLYLVLAYETSFSPPAFRYGFYQNRHALPAHILVNKVPQLRTDGVLYRNSTGTDVLVLARAAYGTGQTNPIRETKLSHTNGDRENPITLFIKLTTSRIPNHTRLMPSLLKVITTNIHSYTT